MPFKIEEEFEVRAPVQQVWEYLIRSRQSGRLHTRGRVVREARRSLRGRREGKTRPHVNVFQRPDEIHRSGRTRASGSHGVG